MITARPSYPFLFLSIHLWRRAILRQSAADGLIREFGFAGKLLDDSNINVLRLQECKIWSPFEADHWVRIIFG